MQAQQVVPAAHHFGEADAWFLEPWREEASALTLMRIADGDDQGHEAPMSAAAR
jgi:hypothetical protein